MKKLYGILNQYDSDLRQVIDYYTKIINDKNTGDQVRAEAHRIVSQATYGQRLVREVNDCVDFEFENDGFVNLIETAMFAGYLTGISSMLDVTTGSIYAYHKLFTSAVGRLSVVNNRWLPAQSVKDFYILKATEKWDAGSLLLHNEMADALLDDNPKAADSISKSVLMKALKPIAAKYGKVRGLKGIRKEKLPTK